MGSLFFDLRAGQASHLIKKKEIPYPGLIMERRNMKSLFLIFETDKPATRLERKDSIPYT